MKLRLSGFIAIVMITHTAMAGNGEQFFALPDSVKATSMLVTVQPLYDQSVKDWAFGISSLNLRLTLEKKESSSGIVFNYPDGSTVVATGEGVVKEGTSSLRYSSELKYFLNYSLLLSYAADSAGNFSIFSAYAYLPEIRKWKLIGTCKTEGYFPHVLQPGASWQGKKSGITQPAIKEVWVQRINGSWKNLIMEQRGGPTINFAGHADSAVFVESDDKKIMDYISRGIPAEDVQQKDRLYYHIENPGSGKDISVTDTVLVHYKGYLLETNEVFDQTTNEPRRFPLNRLIPGWQIGVPLIKTGGRIILVIPAHLGYNIRTRSPKIPPNSILVFEIEVVGTTPAL
jgi:FKBP-type peptidyl-prolyl cis-trans isomerase FkpA